MHPQGARPLTRFACGAILEGEDKMVLPIATLKKGEGRMLKAGGLWVFDNEIASVTELSLIHI